jgi:hypothetical protein
MPKSGEKMFWEDPRFYERYSNTTPPPSGPMPPPPSRFFEDAAREKKAAKWDAPPGYQWVLVKIDDIDSR